MRLQYVRPVKKIFFKQPDRVRAQGRPRKGWADSVEEDLRKFGVTNWKIMTVERLQWLKVVKSAQTRLGQTVVK